MKKSILMALALFAFGFANAQDDDGGFKVGVHFGLPMGDAGDLYTFNFGADVGYMWPVADGLKLGVATGYSYFAGDDVNTGFGTVKVNGAFIPVAASGQYSLTDSFFIGTDLGYALYSGDGDGDGGFYYQPKVGYQMDMLELFVSYKGIAVENSSVSTVGVGAAYKF